MSATATCMPFTTLDASTTAALVAMGIIVRHPRKSSAKSPSLVDLVAPAPSATDNAPGKGTVTNCEPVTANFRNFSVQTGKPAARVKFGLDAVKTFDFAKPPMDIQELPTITLTPPKEDAIAPSSTKFCYHRKPPRRPTPLVVDSAAILKAQSLKAMTAAIALLQGQHNQRCTEIDDLTLVLSRSSPTSPDVKALRTELAAFKKSAEHDSKAFATAISARARAHASELKLRDDRLVILEAERGAIAQERARVAEAVAGMRAAEKERAVLARKVVSQKLFMGPMRRRSLRVVSARSSEC